MSELRLAVTGLNGQIVSALRERAPRGVKVVALGRPQLDLLDRRSVIETLRAVGCDAVVNAAAYTAVDQAEKEPELVMGVNGEGAGHVAEAAAAMGAPLLHFSTDYVFDGRLGRPYREDDPTNPINVYGYAKRAGEEIVTARCADCTILRTSWVYSPFGANFVKSMLRLGRTRDRVRVVADQLGGPSSALDIADALFVIVATLCADPSPDLRGVFHMTGSGEASWADLASAVFAKASHHGLGPVEVERIATADYPAQAQRPRDSRLNCGKLLRIHGVVLPDWRESVSTVVARLMA